MTIQVRTRRVQVVQYSTKQVHYVTVKRVK